MLRSLLSTTVSAAFTLAVGAGSLAVGHVSPAAADTTASQVKPAIVGMIDRQGLPSKTMLGTVNAYVVKVRWADLQPTPNGPITANNAIDQAISTVTSTAYSSYHLSLKLRILTGIYAPQWAKTLDGPAFNYINNQPGAVVAGGTIGRFWGPQYMAAYQDLQTKLAAKYDNVPQVRELTLSGCTTIDDEPFVREFGDPTNVTAMLANGYTKAADEQCIDNAINAADVWKHTITDVDFSPFPDISFPQNQRDLGFTYSTMAYCRQVLANRCGMQNNALSSTKLADPTYQQLYSTMSTYGHPLAFQTATSTRIGDPQQVLAAAAQLGATSVELPCGYKAWPTTVLQTGLGR